MNQASHYYRTDSRQLSFRECWNFTRSWKVFLLWAMKILRIELPGSMGFPLGVSIREQEIPLEEIPEVCREPMETKVGELEGLGFHSPFYHTLKGMLMLPTQDQKQGAAAMLHRSGDAVAIVVHIHHTSGLMRISVTSTAIVSARVDGTLVTTCDVVEQMSKMPGDNVKRLVKAPPAELWRAHQEQLTGGRKPELIRKVKTEEELIQFMDENEKRSFDYQLNRGYYKLMSDREVETMREQMTSHKETRDAVVGSSDPSESPDLPATTPVFSTDTPELHADVLIEIQRQENKEPGWGNAVLILGVSALMFMATGTMQWSWDTALLLLVVMFVHEMGHFVAMKLFEYRNVRMFFIPFFGAAVSGKHYNVPGWKKVIVSLMGPLPGILLGAILGALGMLLGQSFLTETAVMFLIVNGFNLLPFLPLDGGWVMHATLFSRHYMLDTTFRFLAGVGFIAAWMGSGAIVFLILGILVLLALPASFRMAKAVHCLKLKGVPPAASEDDTIPPETAREIIEVIKATYKHSGLPTNILAQHTVQIFEALNSRPPGWLGSGAALLAHASGFVMSIVFFAVFIFGPNPGMLTDLATLSKYAFFGEDEPTIPFDCSENVSWKGADAETSPDLVEGVLVGTLEDAETLGKLYQDLSNSLPKGAACRKFGQTLFLATPESARAFREEWFARLEEHSKNVFVHSARYPVSVSFAFEMPDEILAERFELEMSSFLTASSMGNLIPPWQPNDNREPELKAIHTKARKTYELIQSAVADGQSFEDYEKMAKEMQDAIRRGEKDAMERLQAEEEEKRKARELESVAPLRQREDLDQVLISLWEKSQKEVGRDEKIEAQYELFKRMGTLPLVDGEMEAGVDRYTAQWGVVERDGNEIHMSHLNFVAPAHGLPAFAEWLCSQGCGGIRYSFHSAYGYEDLE